MLKTRITLKSEVLAPKFNGRGTLLVYITPETKDSEWGQAGRLSMRKNWEEEIVGIYAHGANDCDVPEALEKYADRCPRMARSDGIVDAILGKTNEWHEPSGELRDPRPISRARLRNVKLYSYVVAEDYGFAAQSVLRRLHPRNLQAKNRSVAQIDDWVVGTGRRNVSAKTTSCMRCV